MVGTVDSVLAADATSARARGWSWPAVQLPPDVIAIVLLSLEKVSVAGLPGWAHFLRRKPETAVTR